MSKTYNRHWFFYLFLAILWILFAYNTDNLDWHSYELIYENIDLYNIEIGFKLVCKLCIRLGLEYNAVVWGIGTVGLFLISRIIKKYSNSPSVVLVLYAIFPFFLDVIQIRNFAAMVIFLCSIQFILDDVPHKRIKYIIGILVASTFHVVALAYLVFLLIDVKKAYLKLAAWIALGGSVIVLLFPQLVLRVTANIPRLQKYVYSLDDTRMLTKLLFLAILVVMYIMTTILLKGAEDKKEYDVLMKMSVIMFCFYPILIFSVDMFRIIRNTYLLYYMLCINCIVRKGNIVRIRRDKFVLCIGLVLLAVISNYLFISIYSFETVIMNILENNSLLATLNV